MPILSMALRAHQAQSVLKRIIMRRLTLLTLLTLAIAIPLRADRGQSYFTYDDGGTIVKQAEGDRDIDVRINMPLFPGDEVITNRRGRTEIRLSDGNVIALDRATDVRFRSILDSYDGNASQTVAELRYGHVIIQRTVSGHELVRLDTDNASYIASDEAVYAVESDRGRDRIVVFDGEVEVRTPQRTSRIGSGEEGNIDGNGMYGLVRDSANADEFERWFTRRADRYGHESSRYLDRSLAYADDDLAQNGSWTYVSGFNTWAWRPRVSTGWRPYFYGEWMHGLGGSLVWVSYEPWGWVPYHYGRWAFDSIYGWVWLPGTGYSPAWVYWMYGDGYIGWASAGWWDCYRPYYDWAYRPYSHNPWDNSGRWYGRIPGGDIDFRPWTFVNPNHIVGQRVDRGALTIDIVRDRLRRGSGGGFATISPVPARFTRNELRDPATAVNNIVRRGGSGGGQAGDVTPFIRRDPDLAGTIRDRIIRNRPVEGQRPANTAPPSAGGLAPIGGGGLAPIGGGGLAPIGGGGLAPIGGNDGRVNRGDPGQSRGTWDRGGSTTTPAPSGSGGVIRRGDSPADSGSGNRGGTVDRGGNPPAVREPPRDTTPLPSSWRDRVQRPSSPSPQQRQETTPTTGPRRDDWRGRTVRGGETPSQAAPVQRGSDVPRRVIDRIGGARVYPNDGGSGKAPPRVERSSPPRESAPRSSPPPSQSAPPPRVERSSPPPSHNDGGSRGSSSGSGSHSSGSSSSSGSHSSGSSGSGSHSSGSSSGGHSREH
jgi:FecR protein